MDLKSDITKTKIQAIQHKAQRLNLIRNKIAKIFTQILIFILLLGFAYVILYPFIAKISASFMSRSDLYDATVALVPRSLVLDNYKTIFEQTPFFKALFNTFGFSLATGICAVLSSALVGYGLARYNFRGSKLIFILIILTMLVPNQTISIPLYSTFKFFDIFDIFKNTLGHSLQLTNSVLPLVILSITSLGFRGGIFVVLMRQYYKNVPKELIEAAYVDGAGHFRTFTQIILPMARSMLTVVFILAFAWQWTDTFYSDILMGGTDLLSNIILSLSKVNISVSSDYYYYYVLANTGVILVILPLILIYLVFQRQIIEGIERSGLVE